MTLIQSFICFCMTTMMTKFSLFAAIIPFFIVMSEQDVWNANKRAVLGYVPDQKESETHLGTRSKNRKNNQSLSIAPRPWNRRLAFHFHLEEESERFMC